MEQSSSSNVQAMATLRSNLNSVSTALQKRITTCLQHWRHLKVKQQQQQTHQHQHQREYHQRLLYHEFRLGNFASKTSANLKNLNTKFRKFFRKTTKDSPLQRGELNIVAKLLSSTLIATKTTSTQAVTTTTTTNSASVIGLSGINMTITNETIMQIREEYPDLDAEVRSILISRSQTGATIANIRDDYRKNVGLHFPIYDNVTEYLLSIPSVSALCNEHGTRIFNIRPNEKTKHLYDMVQQQKPPQIVYSRPSYPRGGRRRVHPYSASSHRASLEYWRPSSNPQRDYAESAENVGENLHQADYYRHHYEYASAVAGAATAAATVSSPPRQQFLTAEAVADKSIPRSALERVVVDNDCYYQDNCNYYYRRLYNQQPILPAPFLREDNFDNEILNLNDNFNINPTHNSNPLPLTQPIVQTHQSQNLSLTNRSHHSVEKQSADNFRRSLSGPSRATTCSSPSATRSSQTSDSMFTTDLAYEAHLLDFALMGDDFFLYMARMELRCKFKKYEKVLQSGLCISGQNIMAAIKRIREMNESDKHIIVNIGSVDILQGRPLVQIEHDFRNLVKVLRKKGYTPILTTLAPLANYSHEAQIKHKIDRFNTFIKREAVSNSLKVIDIYSCLVNERKQTLFDCYQHEPRSVTGGAESYVFWNKIGRQRVLQLIESKLEY